MALDSHRKDGIAYFGIVIAKSCIQNVKILIRENNNAKAFIFISNIRF